MSDDDDVDAAGESEELDESSDVPQIICAGCLTPNPESAHMCRKCLTPLSSHATFDPIMGISARVDTFAKASTSPRNPAILAGMWLIFGPTAIACFVTGMAMMEWLMGGNIVGCFGLIPAVVLLFISIGLLIKTTVNFIRKPMEEPKGFPVKEDSQNPEDDEDDGEWRNFEEPK